jgi:nucleoside-diphosphate-sugar epimerase
VYSEQNKELNELSDPKPNTPSGVILFEAEELFRQQTAFETTIIRFGGLIGPGRDPGRFFAGKKEIPNGLAPVNMIHQDDCVGLTMAVLAKDVFGYTLNACTPHHPPKSAFYTQAAAKAGLEQPEFIPELKEWKIISGVTCR